MTAATASAGPLHQMLDCMAFWHRTSDQDDPLTLTVARSRSWEAEVS
ncbi:hypothetical protein LPU83_pLPU83b_0428 (plasmid) [Rhizobium favelukesii]|uniref:Uncharacterized protein n=1 Tax=Rhizobium favelukesii TaxID=348824 RepID=W6RNE7_9HYPH|nr:hypothetical protein LPU83_pLPU83b_0428 [Rhizobium favelukesii]